MTSSFVDRLRRPKTIVWGFFIALLLIGTVAHEQYGISWDEPNMYGVGEYAYNYVFNDQPWPEEQSKRYYGTTFELMLTTVRHQFSLEDSRDIFLMRHLLTFYGFVFGVYFFYLLAKHHFDNWKTGLLGALMLVISPRIFSHAFYNSKDIISLSLFVISIYTLVRYLDERTWKRLLIHAAASALVVSVRITGIVVPAITVGFIVLHAITQWMDERESPLKDIPLIIGYLIAWAIGTIILWPFLWTQPVAHFIEAYKFMTGIGVDTFYMGEQIHELPWHYIFVWIGITTPLLYSVFFLTGFGLLCKDALLHPMRWTRERSHETAFILWFFLPIAGVMISGAGIFDGWRHMFFIYPAFLMIALIGLTRFTLYATSLFPNKERTVKNGMAFVMGLSIASTTVWMIRYHPVQNAYFSIPGKYIEGNFELDYWGLSFRPGLEYVLAHDDAPVLLIHPTTSPGYSTINVLRPEQRDRIQFVPLEQAKYILDNFRFHYREPQSYYGKEIHAITVDGIKILGIYKLYD